MEKGPLAHARSYNHSLTQLHHSLTLAATPLPGARSNTIGGGKRADAVLISIDDWRAIQETLHLLSIPGMRASIRNGMKTPVKKCLESLDW